MLWLSSRLLQTGTDEQEIPKGIALQSGQGCIRNTDLVWTNVKMSLNHEEAVVFVFGERAKLFCPVHRAFVHQAP